LQTLTNWMIVLVTVDRYCCVCRPLDAPRCFTSAARRRYVVIVFAAAFIYNLPRYVSHSTYPTERVLFSADIVEYVEV